MVSPHVFQVREVRHAPLSDQCVRKALLPQLNAHFHGPVQEVVDAVPNHNTSTGEEVGRTFGNLFGNARSNERLGSRRGCRARLPSQLVCEVAGRSVTTQSGVVQYPPFKCLRAERCSGANVIATRNALQECSTGQMSPTIHAA